MNEEIQNKLLGYLSKVANEGQHYIPIAFSLMISLPFLCSALTNILIVLKVYFAPRIFLLEYIREIIRN